MHRILGWSGIAACAFACSASDVEPQHPYDRTITMSAYVDKLEGGWIGQMAAGEWGASLEFNPAYDGKFVPTASVPTWTPSMIDDDFGAQADQTWSELPFIETLKGAGAFATWDDFASGWANSPFPDAVLYSANLAARNALRQGVKAPQSGHYTVQNVNTENQTWQMESNWIGMLCPGQTNAALDVDWRAGHVIEFGDGVNGGQMIAAMQSAAFFATSIDDIIDAGRRALPLGSLYRQMVDDIIAWHASEPNDIESVWQAVQSKWLPIRLEHAGVSAPIDARLNGANVILGLLYGGGDFAATVVATMRGGLDGDCTSNDVGSIIGTFLGKSKLDAIYYSALDPSRTFVNTGISYSDVIADSLTVARSIIVARGGSVAPTEDGDEQWQFWSGGDIVAPILEQWPTDPSAPIPTIDDVTIDVDGLSIHAMASASAPSEIAAYQWSFGDLVRQDGADATHVFLGSGSYRVTVWATDAHGNTGWTSRDVVVGH